MKWWNVVNLRVLVETGKKCFGRMIYLNGHVEFETLYSKISLSFTSQTCGVLKSTWTERESLSKLFSRILFWSPRWLSRLCMLMTRRVPTLLDSQSWFVHNKSNFTIVKNQEFVQWVCDTDTMMKRHWWLMQLRRNVNWQTWYKQERWAV